MGEIGETEYDMEMFDYEQLPTHSIYVTMTAGAAAGIMEHCLMYPIDSLKTRLQSLCPCPEQTCRTPVSGFMEMAKREGFLGTYRGVNAIAIGAIPAHALYFSVYEKIKESLTGGKAGHSNTWAYGVAGSAATVVHDAVMNPAEVIKQRMQMCGSPYRSTLECCKCVIRKEGVRALYRSYPTQLILNIPFQSVHFMAYEFGMQSMNPTHKYNPLAHLASGALAGGIAAALTTPFDVVKTVLNTQQSAAPLQPPTMKQSPMGHMTVAQAVHTGTIQPGFCPAGYTGIRDALDGIVRTRGYGGLFSGFQARVFTCMPATAISWSVYELFKYLLELRKGD